MNVFDFLSTRYRGDHHSLSQPMGFIVKYMRTLVGGLCSGHQKESYGWRLLNLPGTVSASGSASFGTFASCSSWPN